MSSSTGNFNDVMRSFLSDLSDVFPEEDAIQRSLETFDALIAVNFKKPQQMFIESVGKFSKQIVERDESMFDRMRFPGFSFKGLWSRDISDGTRGAIWVYLQQLLFLSASK